jgi:hypothetical protein
MRPGSRTAGEVFARPPVCLAPAAVDGFLPAVRGWPAAVRAWFARHEPRAPGVGSRVGQGSARARQALEARALQGDGGKGRALPRLSRDGGWDAGQRRQPG